MTESGFVEIAKRAVEAGFDGFEVHNVYGCLVRQFLSLLESISRLS
jgi:2,4-dienoyl-CoA reductase-like NADH-dependent reductase (Old Yellow Enzyme family)